MTSRLIAPAPAQRRWGAAVLRFVLPVVLLGGCVGGAQPVPPALDPDFAAGRDAGPGAASTDGGAEDAGAPAPLPDLDLEDAVRGARPRLVPPAIGPRDWRSRDFAPPSPPADAGAPAAASTDAGDGASDAR